MIVRSGRSGRRAWWRRAPGQRGERGVQARLVALDGEQLMRATAGQVRGVATLSMHRISRKNRAADLYAVTQHRKHRDFVRLRPHFHLAQDGAMGMIEGSQQVITGFAAAGASTERPPA